MSLLTMDRAALDCFDGICKTVAARGGGLSLAQLGDAAELARVLGSPDPDAKKVEALRRRLGLELELDGGGS